ncbi:MAG: hypothetical protein JWO90_2225, partial [Solirubrobacterales bacterium]|nr:hypothetical protein [Solirubrobacterales bacterium]
ADPASRGAGRTPVDDGARQAEVLGRARAVALEEPATGKRVAYEAAGVGPTNAISRGRWLWVVDTAGDALLVFRVHPELELVRRVFLPGGPFALALDPEKQRLFVTLTERNEVAELPAHGRPSELRRFATVRQPDAVAVDPATGRVHVQGADALQRFDPGPLPPR